MPQNPPNPPLQKNVEKPARKKQVPKQSFHILAKASFEAISWFFRISKGDGRHSKRMFCLRWRETQEALAGVRWQLITVIVMTMGQQLSGINAIYFYATYIFEQAGISVEKIPYVTLGAGACECLTALSCGLLIDYVGRRYLITGGYLLMTLWCTVLTSLTYQELYSCVPYMSIMSLFAFILSFGLGPGGITNTLTAKLFVQSSRPAAYMTGGTVSWISFFTIGMLFPFIVNGLKQYCFLVFLLECSFVAAFIFLVIPETKPKSFLKIKKEFHKLNFGRSTRKKETELYERRKLQDEFLKSSA